MKELHIVTVGISLLTNYAKASNLPLEKVLRRHQQLADFLKEDPRAACSEVNALAASTKNLLQRKPAGLGVTLIYSATANKEGQLTARLIASFLKQRGVVVSEIKLKDSAVPANPQADPVEAARLAQEGLIGLYDKVEKHIGKMKAKHPNLMVAINATGGFKSETAILYGLGCELGLPVYYLHETYRVPIVLPVCAVPF
jgi:putative CRISPR-associated protein (TIGR02619 family)